ncbi:hypothetical protein [Hymenobacter chitinivorans]|uniref:Uncharacterized protein n=1 Tax=Hymenobacter chitinivorans DSM 11115 TaxID=1121954 RepID=A0A2M9BRT2_9BACT|nr:hypothetical protein [Hymenobacter chitinivorans]PJJ60602.1 hypothetical protein CLV45_2031 [Hymenobacter chitinivorans DSM 11115]
MEADKNRVAEELPTPAAPLHGALTAVRPRKRDRLLDPLVTTAATTATKLRPLVELVERVRPHLENDSVFTSRRDKLRAQLAVVHQELHAAKPRHEAIAQSFKLLAEFVRDESREVSKDEVKESAKRFVLVALKTAPDLIRAAHTAGLFS